jgi:hypothetical protein
VEKGEAAFRDWRRVLHVTDAGMAVEGAVRRQDTEEERTPLRAGRGRWGGIVGSVVCGSVPGGMTGLVGDRIGDASRPLLR